MSITNRSRALVLPGAGLGIGLAAAFLLPSTWLFVAAADEAAMEMEADVQYACPMFCVVMDHMPEGGDCPVCGMEMTVISGASTLDAAEQHMIGLEVEALQRRPLVHVVRAVGEVDYDETRLARVTTRVAGWLEKVAVDTTWTEVRRGDALASIFAPDLYAAEREYLAERKAAGPEDPLVQAARRRLDLLGLAEAEIAALDRAGEAPRQVVLRAPGDGTVVERRAIEGASVGKGALLYTIADLDRVWIQAEVFDADLPWLRVGQSVRLDWEGAAVDAIGRVAFVDPVVDRRTRTGRVRIEVDNGPAADGRRPLRIGQRVDVVIEARLDARGGLADGEPAADPLSVPRSAILRTGDRSILYVLFAERDGPAGAVRDYHLDASALPKKVWYEPVEVRVGPLARPPGGSAGDERWPLLGVVPPPERRDPGTGEMVEVLSLRRLDEGVAIVTRGNLLIDSQAQLAGKPSLLYPEGNRGGSSDPHAGH